MNPGRPGHKLGITKCDTCGHTLTQDNAVFMKGRLRGRCHACFSHKAGGNDKVKKFYEGTEQQNPFGGKGQVLNR